jgi:ubiquinone/menaquinone biosynthesis C-methylase UbiE
VSWYEDRILPRVMDKLTGSKGFDDLRRTVTAPLHGVVLEIGFGSGTNVKFFPDAVSKVYAVDPATLGRNIAAPRISKRGLNVEFIGLDGASIELPNASVDCVLSTLTLCTIPDVQQTLSEIARVLKPGGTFHFFEHGLAPYDKTQVWQKRLTPIQKFVAGGCRLNRDIHELIAKSELSIVEYEHRDFFPRGGRLFHMHIGIAKKESMA